MQNWFDSMESWCRPTDGHMSIDWSMRGRGFGQLYFFVDEQTGKLRCSNECLSRERVKEILCMMVDQSLFDEDVEFDEDEDYDDLQD